MQHIMLTIAYDGSEYAGWQIQPNGITIQQRVEEAWKRVTQDTVRIVASGRTDAGVHALAQVCSVAACPKLDCSTLQRALNANTPDDISIIDVKLAPVGFHAIRDASRKTYRYQIQYGSARNPTNARHHWYCQYELDVEAIRQAVQFLTGKHDFASFQAAGAERISNTRFLSKLDCIQTRVGHFQYLDIELTCDGFLYNMVRIIVGTLIKVGQGSEPPQWVERVMAAKDRSLAGPTAPPHGLLLVSVEYDNIEFQPDA